MIIGIDGSRAFIKNKTGTENYSYQLLRHLAKIDHTNNYYIFIRPGAELNGADWPNNFHFQTISAPRLWTQLGLARQTFLQSLDVLFVPAHTLPLFRAPKLKTVVTIHDLGAEYLPQTHQIKQRLYLSLMTNYQLRHTTHLIAVSQATKQDLIKKIGVNPQKISVTYEGFDQKVFKPVKGDALNTIMKEYDLKTGNYFIFVGTIQPRKNLDRLIRAYAKWLHEENSIHKNSRESGPKILKTNSIPTLVLAGSKGWLSDEIYQLPKQLGIQNHVRFLGFVPNDHLPALYSGARALLFPSLFEGFGLPVIEAMACGCPVLTSDTSSLPEVAGKAAILVNPNSIDSITQGIQQIYQPQIRSTLIKKGFDQAKQFSWDKCAIETLQIIQKVGAK